MNRTTKISAMLIATAAVFAALAGCGGSAREPVDPNAAVREEAERRLDTAMPTLSILDPTSSSSYSTSSKTVDISGTASDDRKVERVTWVDDRGGNGIAALSGNARAVNWIASSVLLADGASTVTVRAYDGAGKSTSKTLVVEQTTTTTTAAPTTTTTATPTTTTTATPTTTTTAAPTTATTAADSTVASQSGTTMACRIKGHYVLFEDSESRGVDGYSQVASFLARKDIANFRGVGVLMDWASIERVSGQYDWSRLDRITSVASGSNKRYYISPIERSFHKVCGASGVPSFIPSEGSGESGDHVKCMAKIWEPAVMDRFIALHKAIADRYGNDPNFVGFMEGEITARTSSLIQGDGWRTLMKPQWTRLYREMAAYAPNLMIGNAMGWVLNQDQEELASVLDGFGGGMLSWPDTFAPGYGGGYSGEGWISAAEGSTYGWYQAARRRNGSMIIMPQVQTPTIPATLAAHDYIYGFLRDSIQATAIVWAPWHANDSNYIANVVIPTVNKFGGQLSAAVCPN